MQYNYSIIIPHKNTPDSLKRCLDSIPKRNDIQIIVVDDNSDKIYLNFISGLKRENVELCFTKEGKGAGYARNVGLGKAKGCWLLFSDADDYFIDNCFEKTIDKYISSKADIVYFAAKSIYSDTGKPASRHLNIMNLVNNFKANDPKSQDRLRYNFVNPICKLICHKLIKEYNIFFDEVMFSNDVMFSIYAAYHAKSILAEPTPIYCINVHRGSLMYRKTKESVLCRYKVDLRRNMFLRSIKKANHQSSVMYYLLFSLRNSPLLFLKFIRLAVKYKANILVGYSNWIKTYFRINKNKQIINKYTLYE